jgi:YARHG domain
MRKILMVLIAGIFFVSCNNKSADKASADDKKDSAASSESTTQLPPASRGPEEILGSFVGPFGDNKITLLITKAKGDTIAGRSIVGGNDRPFNGTYVFDNGIYTIAAKEPGDHKDDGAFNFTISKANTDQIDGSWKANDTKRPVKTYTLTRKQFAYNPAAGDYPEGSQRELKPADVENMMKEDLEFMRNEIFARHGYCFNKKNLRQQFEMQEWYVPNTVDIKGYLTDTEKKNIALIKRYEKYAEKYGDEYGR